MALFALILANSLQRMAGILILLLILILILFLISLVPRPLSKRPRLGEPCPQ
jgi:hypothetical protein